MTDSQRLDIAQRARKLLNISSVPLLLLTTLLLAFAANLYEVLCTAGLPMLYARILTLSDISGAHYYLYLAFYNLVYVMPLLFIVLLFVVSLGARRLKESEGRFLKLLSGLMMLQLGLLLLFVPEQLNSAPVAIALLLIAVAASLLIKGLSRRHRSR